MDVSWACRGRVVGVSYRPRGAKPRAGDEHGDVASGEGGGEDRERLAGREGERGLEDGQQDREREQHNQREAKDRDERQGEKQTRRRPELQRLHERHISRTRHGRARVSLANGKSWSAASRAPVEESRDSAAKRSSARAARPRAPQGSLPTSQGSVIPTPSLHASISARRRGGGAVRPLRRLRLRLRRLRAAGAERADVTEPTSGTASPAASPASASTSRSSSACTGRVVDVSWTCPGDMPPTLDTSVLRLRPSREADSARPCRGSRLLLAARRGALQPRAQRGQVLLRARQKLVDRERAELLPLPAARGPAPHRTPPRRGIAAAAAAAAPDASRAVAGPAAGEGRLRRAAHEAREALQRRAARPCSAGRPRRRSRQACGVRRIAAVQTDARRRLRRWRLLVPRGGLQGREEAGGGV